VRDIEIKRQPLRVVVDGNLSMRADALLRLPQDLVVTAADDADYAEPLSRPGPRSWCWLPAPAVDLPLLMQTWRCAR